MNKMDERPSVTQSLVLRTGLALAAIIFSTLVVIVGSTMTTESVEGDAAAINIAGSLRMQSYRIATKILLKDAKQMEIALLDFERRLNEPMLKGVLTRNVSDEMKQSYFGIDRQWQQRMKPMLQDRSHVLDREHPYLKNVDDFVNNIDLMVKLLEKSFESKIRLLRIVQFFSLALTLFVVFIMLVKLQTNVVNPLKELVVNAGRIRGGDFNSRIMHNRDDELGLLSSSFNQMAEDLSKLYGRLESLVEEKTAELRRSNESLVLLYESSRKINEGYQQPDVLIISILGDLRNTAGLQEVALCLEGEGDISHHCLYEQQQGKPSFCHPQNCEAQLKLINCKNGQNSSNLLSSFPVKKQQYYYGELIVKRLKNIPLDAWQNQLINAVADVIANGLSMQQQHQQESYLILVEERTTIARELHDSLAQALSYQKFQVSRLKKAIENESPKDVLDEVVADIREGVDSAYRQLRELLTTFRLQLDSLGLAPALSGTIREFSERSDIQFHYDHQLDGIQLTPNEEIHCLQIIREAISNIVSHSNGENAWLTLLRKSDGAIEVIVEDDGKGLGENPEKLHHYGLAIMQERARSLHGGLQISNRASGGVRIALDFHPQSLRSV